LKWQQDGKSARKDKTALDETDLSKDYDNNLLFKSPLEEQLLESKKNNLDKLK
jgi:hypothetical protein